MDDAREIENLIYRYAEYIDDGNLQAVADLFEHGEITSKQYNSCVSGKADVFDLYRNSCRIYESTGTPQTKHLTTNVIIDLIAADTATARSYYTVLQATESLPLQVIITGRYSDVFQKIDGEWAFSSREMIIDHMGDCSAHLLYDAAKL